LAKFTTVLPTQTQDKSSIRSEIIHYPMHALITPLSFV